MKLEEEGLGSSKGVHNDPGPVISFELMSPQRVPMRSQLQTEVESTGT